MKFIVALQNQYVEKNQCFFKINVKENDIISFKRELFQNNLQSLKQLAKFLKIQNYSTFKKQQLLEQISLHLEFEESKKDLKKDLKKELEKEIECKKKVFEFVSENGTIYHYLSDEQIPKSEFERFIQFGTCNFNIILHNDNDEPAVIRNDGTKIWYQYGEIHRDHDMPAQISSLGIEYWFQHGKLHRSNDLPAQVHKHGTQIWCQHGIVQRENDKPAMILADGTQKWMRDKKLHRELKQPAVIYNNGIREWYINGFNLRYLIENGIVC
jgi:hypothetical protein